MEKTTILSDGYVYRGKAREALDRRYGEIGISAVAAAVRYQGETKTAVHGRDDDQNGAEKAH